MNRPYARKPNIFAMILPPLVVIVVIGAGLLLYYQFYGASSSQYDSAMSNCVRQRTMLSDSSSDKEEATVSCSRDIPGGGGQ
jgi:hypothetical protein